MNLMGYLVGSQSDECLNVGFANVGIAFLRQVNRSRLFTNCVTTAKKQLQL